MMDIPPTKSQESHYNLNIQIDHNGNNIDIGKGTAQVNSSVNFENLVANNKSSKVRLSLLPTGITESLN